ncbi:hypothetical protein TorRG33x02_227370 [Trema orientale]|uniref:Uncharacterized protein n=1 Tax=Trema orientale TaxID=63057 RepID=A0A2P5E7D9_TREOI|nr:hypothetical protein TorRG33x02_227370 [Trema orientale]
MPLQIGPSSSIQVSAHVTMYPKDSQSFATYSLLAFVSSSSVTTRFPEYRSYTSGFLACFQNFVDQTTLLFQFKSMSLPMSIINKPQTVVTPVATEMTLPMDVLILNSQMTIF